MACLMSLVSAGGAYMAIMPRSNDILAEMPSPTLPELHDVSGTSPQPQRQQLRLHLPQKRGPLRGGRNRLRRIAVHLGASFARTQRHPAGNYKECAVWPVCVPECLPNI